MHALPQSRVTPICVRAVARKASPWINPLTESCILPNGVWNTLVKVHSSPRTVPPVNRMPAAHRLQYAAETLPVGLKCQRSIHRPHGCLHDDAVFSINHVDVPPFESPKRSPWIFHTSKICRESQAVHRDSKANGHPSRRCPSN